MKIAVGCDPNAEAYKQELITYMKGVRAANVNNVYSAKRACLSKDCNIITLGSQVTGDMLAKEQISAYLDCTYVYNERSGKKVDAINDYDNAR